MRRIIFSINVTLDGFIDHTAMIADEELHQYFADLLDTVDTLLFGRVIYQIMADFWPTAPASASLTPGERAFADRINALPKIVYSRTLQSAGWNTRIVKDVVPEEILRMKQQPGKDILLGGAGLASTFMRLGLIDEYRLMVLPIILGGGAPLFRDPGGRHDLKLTGTQIFGSGVVLLRYEPTEARHD